MSSYQFDFERLEVYGKAIEFANLVFNLAKKFNRTLQYSLSDQFRRDSLSICNNIAEGSGKQSGNAKRQFYGYSIDSARECIPMITIASMQGEINKQEEDEFRQRCISITQMLAKLIRSTRY